MSPVEDIVSGLAEKTIILGPAQQEIGAPTALKLICPRAAIKRVVEAEHAIVYVVASEDIVAVSAKQRILTPASNQRIAPAFAFEPVRAFLNHANLQIVADQLVVVGPTQEHIVPRIALEIVGSGAPIEIVFAAGEAGKWNRRHRDDKTGPLIIETRRACRPDIAI